MRLMAIKTYSTDNPNVLIGCRRYFNTILNEDHSLSHLHTRKARSMMATFWFIGVNIMNSVMTTQISNMGNLCDS